MKHSPYMNFAKLQTAARYNLASSGVADCTLQDLGARTDDLALHGANAYGYGPLVTRIAGRLGIDPACVVTTAGCSFANHLAMAAVLSPGDEVLLEAPGYELLQRALEYLQARVQRFARHANGFGIDAATVAGAITTGTRLVVLTNLHNPSGALVADAIVQEVARQAAKVGALVLVDEVYLELMFRDGNAFTSFREDENIIVTSSLTKAYGLSGLRCGWILAPAALAKRMWALNDLFSATPPHMMECMSVVAFDHLDTLRARANAMIDANRAAYREILGNNKRLEQEILDQGTTVFPRLRDGDGDVLFDVLKSHYDTSVVPGRFFGCPDRVRIGLAGDIAATRAGFERLAEALGDERTYHQTN
jgi:aspartate/methionine/tyrosine aminotransferase